MTDRSFDGPSKRQLRNNRIHSNQHLHTLTSSSKSSTATSLYQTITPPIDNFRTTPPFLPLKPTRPQPLRRATTFFTNLTSKPASVRRHSSLQYTDGESQLPKTGRKVRRKFVRKTEEGDHARVDRWRNEVAECASSTSSSPSRSNNGRQQIETFTQRLETRQERIRVAREIKAAKLRRCQEYDSDIYDEDQEALLYDVERNRRMHVEDEKAYQPLLEAKARKIPFGKFRKLLTWQKRVKFEETVHAPAVMVADATEVVDPFPDVHLAADNARDNVAAPPLVISEVEIGGASISTRSSSQGQVHPYEGWMVFKNEILVEEEKVGRVGKERVFAGVLLDMRKRLWRLRGVFGKGEEMDRGFVEDEDFVV